MIKTIYLPELCSDEELKTLKGHHLDDAWILHMFDEDVDVFSESGEFILSFRKDKLKETKVGFDNYKKMIGPSRGRGASAGQIDPDLLYWKKRNLVNTNGISTSITVKGKVSKMKINNPVYSTPVGYFDKSNGALGKNLPCRLTSFTKSNFKEYETGFPFLKEIAENYKSIRPEEYNKQNERAELKKDFKIPDTPFSTITINRNFRTALHKDAGDFGGVACLSVLEEGKYNGGIFMIPRFGIGINLRHGDFLVADVHQFHCNTELWTTPEQDEYNKFNCPTFKKVNKYLGFAGIEHDFTRMSFVCYLREKIINCDNPDLIK